MRKKNRLVYLHQIIKQNKALLLGIFTESVAEPIQSIGLNACVSVCCAIQLPREKGFHMNAVLTNIAQNLGKVGERLNVTGDNQYVTGDR